MAVTPELSGSEGIESTETAADTGKDQTQSEPGLLPDDIFSGGSAFCLVESESSAFTLACNQGALSISQNDNRRKSDISLIREYTVKANSASLEIETVSTAAEGVKSDQNAYGFYFVDSSGAFQALRIQGAYFNFENGARTSELEVEEQFNPIICTPDPLERAGKSLETDLQCSNLRSIRQ